MYNKKVKHPSFFFAIFSIAIASTIMAYATKPPSRNVIDKKYSVTLTLPEWAKSDKWLTITKQALSRSDLPAKDVSMILDSLTEYQNKIAVQINTQLEADKKIADTTNKKSKQ